MSKRVKCWVAAAVATGVVGCTTVQTTGEGTVGVDRTQRMSPLVSEAQLRQGAVQAYREQLEESRQKGTLNSDGSAVARVREIARRLVAVTPAFRPDAREWEWEANVISSDQVNAWVMPGGKIAVYTGLIDKLNLSDDELAAVMGHEIAHALREHARERASQQATAGLLIQGGAAVLGAGSVTQDMAKLAYQVTFGLPNSRVQESEADRIGVELAARAGFDPSAAVTLWQKMAQAGGGRGGPEWLSTHPDAQTRIKDLQVYAQRVQPLYAQARRR